MTKEVTAFVVYIINELANAYGRAPSSIYRVLERTGCIKNYLVPFYDVLHTMSSGSVMDDVVEYVNARGASI